MAQVRIMKKRILFCVAFLFLSSTASLAQTIPLTPISTPFNTPIGIDHHQPTNKVVVSVNYPSGNPRNFELVGADGSRQAFSAVSGLTDEVKIATVRETHAGFVSGELFVGNGLPGQIVRISPTGSTVQNPWVTLPGELGLLRGSLYIDRTNVFGGDLIAVTTAGGVWRVTSSGTPTKLASLSTHLEGVVTVPNDPAKYGPWAGKILAGAEGQSRIYAIAPAGTSAFYTLGINPEDFDIIPANENFFGVNYGGGRLMGAPASAFAGMVGDILVTQEGGTLWRVHWNPTTNQFEKTTLATVPQWEHVTFSSAGIVEIPPSPPAFTLDLPLPTPDTRLCLPPFMVQDPTVRHQWWARATGSGQLEVRLFGIGVNPSEAGTVTMNVYNPSNAPVGTANAVIPASGENPSMPSAIVVSSPGSGQLYRIEVSITGAPAPPNPTARHYRLELKGASLLGTNSPLQAQSEHDNARWGVNAAAAETLTVSVSPGPEAGATLGTFELRSPGGVLLTSGTVPSTLFSSVSAAGHYSASVTGLNGHYVLDKTSGNDRGLYVNWMTWGEASISGTILRGGVPNTIPVTVRLTDTFTGVITQLTGITGSYNAPKMLPGTYTVEIVWGSTVVASKTVTISCGVSATADFDIPIASLRVIKNVVNDNGGPSQAGDFRIDVTGIMPTPASFQGSENGINVTLVPGSYEVSESSLPLGYAVSYSPDCRGTIGAGETKTCTVRNDDIGPKLTVTKVVVNDSGGTRQVSDFPLFVGNTSVTSGVPVVLNAGTYTVSETNQFGYAAAISGDCAANGSITLSFGDVKTCTITNNDFPTTTVGRMTGGGSVFTSSNVRVTHGMTLRCNASAAPQNLEINWGRGENFHLTGVTRMTCVDDPRIGPAPPAAGFDSLDGEGVGRYNNLDATVSFNFTDAGEPGRADTARIIVRVGSSIVLDVSGTLNNGNHQAHSN